MRQYITFLEIKVRVYIFGRRRIGGLIEEKRRIWERCWRVVEENENENESDDESWLVW